jgi:hypothetical protein
MSTKNNVTFLTTPEANINVDVNKQKRFTTDDLNTLIAIRSTAAHPNIYGSKAPSGIKYRKTVLIDLDLVEDNNEWFSQLARISVNPKINDIQEDIIRNGWNLAELPVHVMEGENGKFVVLEGRTRFSIAKALGMKNIIADVFDNTTLANALRFAISCNAQKKPYGEASVKDIRKVILKLVSMPVVEGGIDSTAEDFAELVREEILDITTKLKPKQMDQIVFDAIEIRDGESPVISFPDGRGSKEWLEAHNYRDSQDRIFVPVGTFEEKVLLSMIRKEQSTPSSVREICYVVHGGTLDSKNPEQSWIKGCRDFNKRFKETLLGVSETFFDGAEIDMKRVKLYGAIPMVKSLKRKYPMNKIYYYN